MNWKIQNWERYNIKSSDSVFGVPDLLTFTNFDDPVFALTSMI